MPEAGWYPDPEDAGLVQWWDGTRWADERQERPPVTAGQSGAPVASGSAPPRRLRRAFSFRGRSPRRAFWGATGSLVGSYLAVLFIGELMYANQVPSDTIDRVFNLLLPVWLIFVAAFFATFVRRLHDVGRSGWNLLLAVVPLVLPIVFYWATRRGEPLANRYGDPVR